LRARHSFPTRRSSDLETGAAMVELMDRASLRSVEDLEGMPAVVKTLPPGASALLVEFQEDTPESLEDTVSRFENLLGTFSLLEIDRKSTRLNSSHVKS